MKLLRDSFLSVRKSVMTPEVLAVVKTRMAEIAAGLAEAWEMTNVLIVRKQGRDEDEELPLVCDQCGSVPMAHEIEDSGDSLQCQEEDCTGTLTPKTIGPMTYDPEGAARRRDQLSEGLDEDDGEDKRLTPWSREAT